MGAFFTLALLTLPLAALADQQSSITDFGALPDGKTLSTSAIQQTIDHLASSGGGTVIIPQGTFLTSSIFLKPGVNLHLNKDAVLKGSGLIADYPRVATRVEGHFQPWVAALINADRTDHLRIDGDGTIDGGGQPYWTAFRQAARTNRGTKNLDVPRPRMFFISRCADVQVSGLHLKDSGFWNLHVYHCDGVALSNLDIRAPQGAPSTDGMDIDSSQNVAITGCTFSVSDDCIALKGSKGPLALDDESSPPVENIIVSNCTFLQGGSIVTCGSEATIVRDVHVEHCTAEGPNSRGITVCRLKLRPDTPQDYEDLHFHDITLNGLGRIIGVEPWRQYFDLQGHAPPTRTVRNITLDDVHGSFGSFGVIQPNPGDTLENITLQNINVKLTGAPPHLVGVKNLTLNNVTINGIPYTGPTTQPSTRPTAQ